MVFSHLHSAITLQFQVLEPIAVVGEVFLAASSATPIFLQRWYLGISKSSLALPKYIERKNQKQPWWEVSWLLDAGGCKGCTGKLPGAGGRRSGPHPRQPARNWSSFPLFKLPGSVVSIWSIWGTPQVLRSVGSGSQPGAGGWNVLFFNVFFLGRWQLSRTY